MSGVDAGALLVALLFVAAFVWGASNLRRQSRQADAALALDGITEALRRDGWQPPHPLPCGCDPSRLCPFHAEQRAVDHYSRPGWSS